MSRHKYAVEEWTYNWMDRNASGTRPHQGSLYTNLMGHCMQRQRMNQAVSKPFLLGMNGSNIIEAPFTHSC